MPSASSGWATTARSPVSRDCQRRSGAHIGDELADVLCYLVRLADVCKVDLSSAVLGKIEKNAEKYPADKVRGSSAKYTAYRTD